MKVYLLIGSLLILILHNLFGEVKNGYEKDIASFSCSLQGLKNILSNNHYLSTKEERKIKAKIKSLINYMVYYEITDKMLKQFKSISPDLFYEMDTLRNCKGKIIDVYVKFIPKWQAQFQGAGMASFEQASNDFNSCNSEYGESSVSIKIWAGYNTLRVLSHEFGHVKYLVPNLKTYVEFYRKKYTTPLSNFTLGHSADDESGQTALVFEQRFRESHARYLKHETTAAISSLTY